jgi:hypothetical protein
LKGALANQLATPVESNKGVIHGDLPIEELLNYINSHDTGRKKKGGKGKKGSQRR